MHGKYEYMKNIGRRLVSEEDTLLSAIEARSESRDWKWINSSTKGGVTNQVSCNKDAEDRTANADYVKGITG
jgi:hypothetical protein